MVQLTIWWTAHWCILAGNTVQLTHIHICISILVRSFDIIHFLGLNHNLNHHYECSCTTMQRAKHTSNKVESFPLRVLQAIVKI